MDTFLLFYGLSVLRNYIYEYDDDDDDDDKINES